VTTLDRYILGKIGRPLLLLLTVFIGIFILVDLFDHAHTFIDNEVPIGSVLAYYVYYLPLIIVLTSPVAMLLATLLSVGGLARRHEMMAMKGSGVSLYRILAPVLALAVLVSAFDVFVGEILLPPATRQRIVIEDRNEPIYVLPDGTIFVARRLNTRTGTLEEVTVEEFSAGGPLRRIDAERAEWRDGEWYFYEGQARLFSDEGEESASFDSYAPGYTEPTPDQMGTRRLEPDEMAFRELRAYIGRLRAGGNNPLDLDVQLHLKISFPFVTVIMTLMGGAIAASARRSGFALAFAAALSISFLYYGLLQVGQVLGRQDILVPWLAAWIANIAFAGVGTFLLVKAPK
jgi:lipopolysaccharide export system permease protein